MMLKNFFCQGRFLYVDKVESAYIDCDAGHKYLSDYYYIYINNTFKSRAFDRFKDAEAYLKEYLDVSL